MSDTRTLRIVVSGDSSGGRRALQQIGQEASATSGKFDKVSGAMAGFATKGGIALGALAVGAGVLGVTTASKMEQAQVAFTNMLGSGQKASSFLKELQAFANSTPFEFPDLVRSSQQLLSMGFKAQDIIPTLTAVGDAVAAMGGSADNIAMVTRAFGQMQAKGKVAGDELLQLTEQGIPAIRILADGYGVSTSQMSAMVTKGQVLSEKALPMLVAGLEKGTKSVKGFGGMMEVQSKTAQGRWSTLVDTVQMGLGNLAIKAFPLMNQGIIQVTAGATALVAAFQTGAVTKGGGIVGMFTTVGLAARAFGQWIGTDGIPLVQKLGTVFKAVADVVGPVLGVAFAALILTVRGVWTVFTSITGVLSQHPALVRVLTAAVVALGLAWLASTAYLKASNLALNIMTFPTSKITKWIMQTNIAKAATAAWTAAHKVLELVMKTGTVGLVIAGITALVAVVVLIATKTTWFQTIWEYMSGALVASWKAITTAASWAWNTILKPIFTFIGSAVGLLVTGFQTGIGFIVTAWHVVTGAVSTAWHTVMAPVFGFIQGGIAIVVALFRVWQYFASLYVRAIAAVMQWAWTTILSPVFNWIGMALGVMWMGFQTAANWIKVAWNAVATAAQWAWNTVLSPVFNWIGMALGVMWRGFQTAANWIKVAWNAIVTAAQWAWNTILSPVFTWIKNGLSTLWGAFITAKNWIVNAWETVSHALRKGWDTGFSVVFGYIKTGVDAVRGAFKTAVDAIGKAWTTMKDLVSKPIYAVLTFIGQHLSKPINTFLTNIGAGTLAKLPEWNYKAAQGGVLPGFTPGRDIHRFTSPTGGSLNLSGGEAIMVPEFTRAAGGASGVARLNALARRGASFAGGGIWESMASWISKAVPGSFMSSGFRPNDGGSYHAQGSAIDIVPPSMKVFNAIANSFGSTIRELIYSPAGPLAIKNGKQVGMDYYGAAVKAAHYNHVHWAQTPGGTGPDPSLALPDIVGWVKKIGSIVGGLKNIGGGLWGKAFSAGKFGGNVIGALKDKLTSWVASMFSAGTAGTGGTATGNRALGLKMMMADGWAQSQFNSLDRLWTKESKWSTGARNATSGAYGIPQAYPANKMQLAGADWMTNAATQIKWGLSYIRENYGSPEQAWAHSVRTGWYDDEGILPPGRTVAMNGTGRNEYVSKTPPGGGGITVAVTVMGSVTTERDLVKSITLGVRDELRRHADRNGGRTGL